MSDELQEAMFMVTSLRLIELRSLLTVMGLDKNGLKKDLVQRAQKFLHKELNPMLLSVIQELYDERCATNSGNSRHSRVIAEVKVNCSKKSDTNPHSPVPEPEVQLIKLPFYHTLEAIVAPVSLVSNFEHTMQINNIMLSLTSTQWAQIGNSQETKNGWKSVQVVLRFCYTHAIGVEDDQYPPSISVSVNGVDCPVQAHYASCKKQLEPSRPCCPINLTPHLKQFSANTVSIMWKNFGKHYSAAIHLVRVFSSADLLEQLQTKEAQSVMYYKERICEKLCSSPENEIATTGLQVSLICPLAKLRMTVPCRALTCAHLQCFDAAFYLQMNERKPTWTCPVCHKPACFESLQIDSLLRTILNCTEEAVNEIQYLSDGSWRAVVDRTSDSSTLCHEVSPVVQDFVDLTLDSSDSDADDVDAVHKESLYICKNKSVSSTAPNVKLTCS